MQQRTGKSLTILLVLARLWRAKSVRRAIIFCPKTAISVWKRQARLHLNIPYKTFEVDDDIPSPKGELQILLVSISQSWRPSTEGKIAEFIKDCGNATVDESHRIKSHRSRQSRAIAKLCANVPNRIAATGTPSDEDEVDLFAQFRFLAPGVLGADWREFEKRWLRKSGFGRYQRKLKRHLRKKFFKRLGPYIFQITRDEALDLPPETEIEVTFPLSGKAAKYYKQLEEELWVEIQDEEVVTPMRVTQMVKLQQICGGFLQTENAIIRLEQDKLGAVLDWIEDYKKEKIVVFARFTEEIDALRYGFTKAGRNVGVLDGRTNDRTIWERFQDDDDPHDLIVQAQTGGESIELSAGDIAIFYSKTFSYLQYSQCYARLLGRRKNILFAHFNAENSIDGDLMTAVERKRMNTQDVLRQLKRRRKRS